MSKIDSLTPEQEALMPEYVDKWIKVGTDTTNVSLEETKEIVRDFRELINLNPDVPLVMAKNPIESWVKCCLWELGVKLDDLDNEMEKVFNKTSSYSIPQASLPYNTNLLSYVFSFYDYMFNVVGVKIEEDLLAKYKVWERTSKIFAIYPLEGLTVVCEKPTAVKLNENKVLHCDGGAALEFAGLGDFKIYALNGVRVPEYLAVTPSHKLDLNQYTKETNADIKAEFIRKAGVERFLEMGKLVDSYTKYDQEDHPFWWQSEYELYDMKALFPSLKSAPYIKMRNFTTKIFHMEGVSPKCKTVKDALKERFGGRDMRIVAGA
jgi:hypothetical protein